MWRPCAVYVLLASNLLLVAGIRSEQKLYEIGRRSTKKVRLLLVRHGLSCANVIGKYGSGHLSKMQHKNFRDPPLSDCGRVSTEVAAAALQSEHVDYVISSAMMRAIETAWIQFGHRKVHVIPHIGEAHRGMAATAVTLGTMVGLIEDADNTPNERKVQESMLKAYYPDIQVDYRYRNDTADHALPSNWEAFEEFLEKQLLPELEKTDPKDSYTLGVGTHSLFLRYSIGRRSESATVLPWRKEVRSDRQKLCVGEMPLTPRGNPGKPYNNQVLEIFFDYDREKGLQLDANAGCRTVGRKEGLRYGPSGRPQQLCEADFANCVPVWRKLQKMSTTRDIDTAHASLPTLDEEDAQQLASGNGSRKFAGPAKCETYHLCGEFPKIESVEQQWADDWKDVSTACSSAGVDTPDCGDLPERPDVSSSEVCTCVR